MAWLKDVFTALKKQNVKREMAAATETAQIGTLPATAPVSVCVCIRGMVGSPDESVLSTQYTIRLTSMANPHPDGSTTMSSNARL